MTQAQQWGQQAPQQFAPQQQAPTQWGQQAPPQNWAPAPEQPQQWAPQPPAQQAPAPTVGAPQVDDTSGMFGGAPSISWNTETGYVLGTPRGGQVVGKQVSQQTDFKTKAPLMFPDGKPRMQIVCTLQTRERTDATDDGKRTIYINNLMVREVAAAFRAVGATDIEIGGWFYAANTSKTGGKGGKANTFQCAYARPGQPDPLAHLPAYVAPVAAPVQQQAPQQFQAPMQPNYPPPGPQQFQQPQAPSPQFGAPPVQQGPPQGYVDPNQGQQQVAPQQPVQPQFAQQGAPQGGGAPAGFNPFAQQ